MPTSTRPSSSEARRLRVEQLRQKHASRRSLLVDKEEEGVAPKPMSASTPPALEKDSDASAEEEPSSSSRSLEEVEPESIVAVANKRKKQSGRKRFSPPGIERGLAALVSSRAGSGNSKHIDGGGGDDDDDDDDADDEEAQREVLRHHKRQRRTKSTPSKLKQKPSRASSSSRSVRNSQRNRNEEINISPRATDEDASLFNNPDDREASLDRVRAGIASLSLLLQGILAGFAISTLLMAIPNREVSAFIADYAQHANETRRFYFLVVTACLSSSLCLVVPPRDSLVGGTTGAMTTTRRDIIGTMPEGMVKWWWLVAVCYLLGLVLTLPIAVVDVKLAMLDDGIGADDIRLWRSLSIIRSICCLLAWLLVCWQQSKAYERRREILKWYN